jgi:hypothetical protein
MSYSIRSRIVAAATSLMLVVPLRAADVTPPDPGLSGTPSAPEAPAADSKPPATPELPPLSEEAQQLADDMKARFAEGTEPRQMLDAIIAGADMGPQDGWFNTAVAQTKFTWDVVAGSHDKNGDGSIGPDEFGGGEVNFRWLDRDRSGAVTVDDLSWPDHALARSPATMLFFRGDQDGNGKLTREEFAVIFEQFDRERAGELCADDLKDAFTPSNRPPAADPNEPTREILLKGLDRQEIGAWNAGPSVGEIAPDFTLKTVDGKADVNLRDRHREKPLVLVFGNFTCGPFRAHSGNVERVYRRHHDEAEFLMVYVREAHPTNGWRMTDNDQKGVEVTQPASDFERTVVAQQCHARLKSPWTMVVDRIDDEVGRAYSGMPSRLYVIDTDGTVVYKSGRGPFGFKPAEMEQSLIWLLAQKASATSDGKPVVNPAR